MKHACLQDLRTTDPSHDKTRIQRAKGGLLKASCDWILENGEFLTWLEQEDSYLLWIKGDPGKGKTMLLCGIIDEMIEKFGDTPVAFFFCEVSDVRINNATAVLRGLIYSLVKDKPKLLSLVRRAYDQAGKSLFEDVNAWDALLQIFKEVLNDLAPQRTFLIIDGLDECTTGLPLVLDLLYNSSEFAHVKWIASSRNWPLIEGHLDMIARKATIGLELNSAFVTKAVAIYIDHKVQELARLKRYTEDISRAVHLHLSQNSRETFLWVSLVCQELRTTSRRKTQEKLKTFPPGLTDLYRSMIKRIDDLEDSDICKEVLATICTLYRPITLDELVTFLDEALFANEEDVEEVVKSCGSFLTLQDKTIYFVHQSAKEFLTGPASIQIFRSGIKHQHRNIFSQSLTAMFAKFRDDLYGLKAPGFPIDQVTRPDPDPLAQLRYSCLYWVEHLYESDVQPDHDGYLQTGRLVDNFLSQKYLNWLEALSLIGGISEGVLAMAKLEESLKV